MNDTAEYEKFSVNKKEVLMAAESPSKRLLQNFYNVSLTGMRLVFVFIFSVLISFVFVPKGSAEQINLPVNLPGMKDAKYVGTETCATCHDKQYKEFKLSTHSRIAVSEVEGIPQGCEMCHGPGSNHVDAGGGKGVGKGAGTIINPRKNPEICFSCHMDKKAEFRLPYHHPVLEGKMSCADCHKLHGSDARPWTATSMEDVNEVCFKCHKDQRGPFPWEHQALRDGCTTCHKVHGSITDKMLVTRDSNLCLRCHIQTTFSKIGNSDHNARLLQGTCWSSGCHTAPHGSYFDRHLRE